jgi:hypothetical protein
MTKRMAKVFTTMPMEINTKVNLKMAKWMEKVLCTMLMAANKREGNEQQVVMIYERINIYTIANNIISYLSKLCYSFINSINCIYNIK